MVSAIRLSESILSVLSKLRVIWTQGVELPFGSSARRSQPSESQTIASIAPSAPANPQDQLAQLYRMCGDGRLAAAELELHNWRRSPDCPPAAQVMLASLLSRRREADQALAVLDEQSLDVDVLQIRIVLLTALSRVEEAGRTTRTLYHEHGQESRVTAWLAGMQAPGCQLLPPVPQTASEQLAGELFENTRLVRSLVIAQKLRADLKNVCLLRNALIRLWRDVGDRETKLIVCEGVAELSMLLGDVEEARHWASVGLEIDPYFAPLALVISQLADQPQDQPKAIDVLSRTHEAHPTYRDVRAALIRRQFAQGQADVARQQLENWRQQEPDHQLVKQLQQELAA